MKKYDLVVIGFGKAGKTLSGAMAKKGKKAALIEKDPNMYGGTCINVGCIPSKSLVTSAAKSAALDGTFEEKALRYAAAIAEKRRVTALLRGKNYKKLDDLENVDIYDGTGHFISENQVEVIRNDGTKEILEADKIVINTGSSSASIAMPGTENNPAVHNSTSLMELDTLPKALTIIGAGYIGMEFASMYANFGSAVTVVQKEPVFLPREDRDIAENIHANLEKQGVKFVESDPIRIDGNILTVARDGREEKIAGDAILIAAGRRPNTAGLDLDKAGVKVSERGGIVTDELLRTDNPNIFAAGDVNGGPQFTFISLDDYRIILPQLIGKEGYSRADRQNAPYSVFMDTPLARVGLSEDQASKMKLSYRVVKMPAGAVPKAQVLRKTDGMLKALIDTETGKIIGAALLCAESYEMINTVRLAMQMGADYTVLRDSIYTHPTMTEAFNDLFAM